MSCKLCNHWRKPELMDWNDDNAVGYCTLNPTWVKTSAAHYCSQLMNTSSHYESTLLHHYNKVIHGMVDETKAAKQVARELKEKLKAARAKLKPATQPGSPDEPRGSLPPRDR